MSNWKSNLEGTLNTGFATNQELKRHSETVHEGSKFDCNLCDKSFSRKNRLKHHIKNVHEEKKLLNCNFCDSQFETGKFLQNHLETVHVEGKISFECSICHFSFFKTVT